VTELLCSTLTIFAAETIRYNTGLQTLKSTKN